MLWRSFQPGDRVVYRKPKHTTHPGRRAKEIQPTPKGDYYAYVVDKFWIVRKVLANGSLLLETRRGKTHVVDANDPNLRRSTMLDRIRYRSRLAQFRQGNSAG